MSVWWHAIYCWPSRKYNSHALQLRHNQRNGVTNPQPHDCLLNRLFRRRSKKYQSSASLAFVKGIQPGTGEFSSQKFSNGKCFHLMTSTWFFTQPFMHWISSFSPVYGNLHYNQNMVILSYVFNVLTLVCLYCTCQMSVISTKTFSGMWWRIITNLAISATEKCSHIVYLLNVQIVIMSIMLNVSMQTEIMLSPVLCGTVCIVCKLYFHLTTLKITRKFFQWSWKVSRIILFSFMKWTPRCSFHLKLMKAPTEMDPNIQFYSSTHYALNTQCEYFIEDTFLTNITEKNKFQNKLSLFHINDKSLPKHHDELELYINSLNFKFSVIALTENWLDESKQDLFDREGYNWC